MEFYSLAGRMALGSRLRRLADVLTADAEKLYQLYEVEIDPRWFPVFYMLTHKKSAAITELAEDIGQSHPAVSQVVREMIKANVVESKKCADDARVNRVSLTVRGKAISKRLSPQCADINIAVDDIFKAAGSDLWAELDAVEYELSQNSLYERVSNVRKNRESQSTDIVPYAPKYKKAYKRLNEAWIEKHWKLEKSDHKALDKPKENIINRGGYIAIAVHKNEAVGTCSLINMGDGSYELAKMAVDEAMKGKGLGYQLGSHILDKARELGAKRVYLESNTILAPALNLYRKLGFRRITGPSSPYDRCNIQMELML
jgi:DNA-binding MarR family transcriptional regulator/N-acetylglutamate synthase-like GNAT family acetyltransferase